MYMAQEVGTGPMDVQSNGMSVAAQMLPSFHQALRCPVGLGALYVDPKVLKCSSPGFPLKVPDLSPTHSDLIVTSDEVKYHHSTRRYT